MDWALYTCTRPDWDKGVDYKRLQGIREARPASWDSTGERARKGRNRPVEAGPGRSEGPVLHNSWEPSRRDLLPGKMHPTPRAV